MITMVSRGEVYGGGKTSIGFGIFLYVLVLASICSLTLFMNFNIMFTIPFLLIFLYLTFPALIKAYSMPIAINIRTAVKTGVISLIALDATIASGFSGWLVGLIILCCLPLSILAGRWFAVT